MPEVAWPDLHLHLIGDVVTLPPLADITTLALTDIDRERMRTSEVAADQVPNTADCRLLVTINRRLPCAVRSSWR